MNVYILSEITKRELDSNLLVSLISASYGNSILITNMDTIEFLSKKNFYQMVYFIQNQSYMMIGNKIFILIYLIKV